MNKPQSIAQPKNILVGVESLEKAFEISLSNKEPNVVYIKVDTLREYLISDVGFVSKIFGDRESGMFLTFIYKDGDKEFERENLEKKILEFKKLKILQDLIDSMKKHGNDKK